MDHGLIFNALGFQIRDQLLDGRLFRLFFRNLRLAVLDLFLRRFNAAIVVIDVIGQGSDLFGFVFVNLLALVFNALVQRVELVIDDLGGLDGFVLIFGRCVFDECFREAYSSPPSLHADPASRTSGRRCVRYPAL